MVDRFRYRSLLDALWSLRGRDHFASRAPHARGVRYARAARRGVAPLGDVYLPDDDRAGSALVFVHGGGFVLGSRDMKPARFIATRLAHAGIAVASIDYRMIFRGGRLDEALEDVIAAHRFFAAYFAERGVERVSLGGLSAGATLSMLAAARLGGEVHRLVCGFGLYELGHLHGPMTAVVPRLLFRTRDRETWARRSPRGDTQPACPTLLLHGTADGLVPVAQARALAAHRERMGLATRLVVYEGAPHGFFHRECDAAEEGVREIIAHVGVG